MIFVRWIPAVLIVVIIAMSAGCIEENEKSEILVNYTDDIYAYTVPLPESYSANIENNQTLVISDSEKRRSIVVQPYTFDLKNITAQKLSEMLISDRYGDTTFTSNSYQESKDRLRYYQKLGYKNSIEDKQAIIRSGIYENTGYAFLYEAPAETFETDEKILVKILSGLTVQKPDNILYHPGMLATGETIEISPVVLETAFKPDYNGSVRLNVPSDFTAGEQLSLDDNVNWWTGDKRYYSQVFVLNNIIAFDSMEARENALSKIGDKNVTQAGPVQKLKFVMNTPITKGYNCTDFINSTLTQIVANPSFMLYYPNIMGITNITITDSKNLTSGEGFLLEFVRDKKPETAKVIVYTRQLQDGLIDTSIYGISAPADEFNITEPFLADIMRSAKDNSSLSRDIGSWFQSQSPHKQLSKDWNDNLIWMEAMSVRDVSWFPKYADMNTTEFLFGN